MGEVCFEPSCLGVGAGEESIEKPHLGMDRLDVDVIGNQDIIGRFHRLQLAQTGALEEALVDYDDGVADAGVARIGNVPLLGTEHSERQFGHLL
jgi:hypothetical protein